MFFSAYRVAIWQDGWILLELLILSNVHRLFIFFTSMDFTKRLSLLKRFSFDVEVSLNFESRDDKKTFLENSLHDLVWN